MRSRIAPPDDRQEHELEMRYLTDLSLAIKTTYYKLDVPSEYAPVLSIDRVAMWNEYRRNLLHCRGFGSFRPRFDGRSKHMAEIETVDGVLEKIKRGIEAGNPIAFITEPDIEALGLARANLGDCKERLIYY